MTVHTYTLHPRVVAYFPMCVCVIRSLFPNIEKTDRSRGRRQTYVIFVRTHVAEAGADHRAHRRASQIPHAAVAITAPWLPRRFPISSTCHGEWPERDPRHLGCLAQGRYCCGARGLASGADGRFAAVCIRCWLVWVQQEHTQTTGKHLGLLACCGLCME